MVELFLRDRVGHEERRLISKQELFNSLFLSYHGTARIYDACKLLTNWIPNISRLQIIKGDEKYAVDVTFSDGEESVAIEANDMLLSRLLKAKAKEIWICGRLVTWSPDYDIWCMLPHLDSRWDRLYVQEKEACHV